MWNSLSGKQIRIAVYLFANHEGWLPNHIFPEFSPYWLKVLVKEKEEKKKPPEKHIC